VKLTKGQRAILFSMFDGCCAYCGCELLPGWHADHVEPIIREGKKKELEDGRTTYGYIQTGRCDHPERENFANLVPACRSCNINKGCTPLEVWRDCLERMVDGLRRDHPSVRIAERFGLITQTKTVIVFHFEAVRAK